MKVSAKHLDGCLGLDYALHRVWLAVLLQPCTDRKVIESSRTGN